MAAVEVAVAVVVEVLHHLLGGPLDPPRGLRLRALVAAEGAEVPGLGLYYAAGVVVGERVLRVLRLRLRLERVAGRRSPGVRRHRR